MSNQMSRFDSSSELQHSNQAQTWKGQDGNRNLTSGLWVLSAVLCAFSFAARAQTGFPFQDESLHYSVNWPSGLSLGDASLTAHLLSGGWNLEMTLDAKIPGFSITDRFRSLVNQGGCSQKFERNTIQGTRKTNETTVFVSANGTARRTTANGGGATEFPIPDCARDALAFIYYARREMGQGRVTAPQEVHFGGAYSVRMEYTGAQTIVIARRQSLADRVVVYLKGPASIASVEIFFARDPARTPLLIRAPFSVGTLSMELAP
jgi:hypothetical protein